MAMLAEPRRKQKIGPNPRGKFFMEDTSNKGRTLLQKLGWQTGDGLGRSNQGMSAPICPKIQNDAKGLGYDPKNDPWVVHNEEFSQILQNLQPVVPEKVPELKEPIEEAAEDEVKNGKLENKSKKSKFRIHYHKFVKSKDVSNFSKTDLKCIFGKPTDALISKEKPNSDTKADPDTSEGFKTINSGSMADYFKSKMLKLKSALPPVPEVKSEEKDDKLNQINRGSMLDYFKAKMEERRQKAAQSTEYQPITGEDEVDLSIVKTEETVEVEEPSKKSKKKRKQVDEIEESEEIPQKKSKKDKPVDEDPEVTQISQVQDAIDAQKVKNCLKREKRKKAKHAEGYELMPTESLEIVTYEPVKKKKKKSKEPQESQEDLSPVENQESPEETQAKKKKKKKSKYEELDESVENSNSVAEIINEESTTKKSKKKSKSTEAPAAEEMQASDHVQKVKKSKKKSKSSDEEQLVEAQDEATAEESSSFRKKKDKKHLKAEELHQVSKGFPGANLHEISGYAFY